MDEVIRGTRPKGRADQGHLWVTARQDDGDTVLTSFAGWGVTGTARLSGAANTYEIAEAVADGMLADMQEYA